MITIVIPAYNEALRLRPTLERLAAYFESTGEVYEIVVCDDGSRDGTAAIAENCGATVLRSSRRAGKGDALRRGVLASRGEFVLLTDADLSTPIRELERLRPVLAGGAHVVLGSRGLSDSVITRRQPFYREYMGKTFNLLVRACLGWQYRDTQCGFKLLRGDAARRIFAEVRERGFGCDVEMIHLALRMGYTVREMPVSWEHSPDSRVHILTSSWSMLGSLLRVVSRERRGAYAAARPPSEAGG